MPSICKRPSFLPCFKLYTHGTNAATQCTRQLERRHTVPLQFACRLEQAKELDFSDDSSKAEAHQRIDFDGFEHETLVVQEACKRLAPDPCFAHNDLLSGNILVPDEVCASCSKHPPSNTHTSPTPQVCVIICKI